MSANAAASLLAQMLFEITQASGLAGRADSETPDVALDAIDTVDEHCVETVVTLATGDRYRVTVEWLREESP